MSSRVGDQLCTSGQAINFPSFVRMAENPRFNDKVTGARITRTAEWWFVSIQIEMPDEVPVKKPVACGTHVGLNRLATLR
jgi:putative transposase